MPIRVLGSHAHYIIYQSTYGYTTSFLHIKSKAQESSHMVILLILCRMAKNLP